MTRLYRVTYGPPQRGAVYLAKGVAPHRRRTRTHRLTSALLAIGEVLLPAVGLLLLAVCVVALIVILHGVDRALRAVLVP